MDEEAWGQSWTTRLREQLERLEGTHNSDWTEYELRDFLRWHQRLAQTTVDKYVRHLDFMADYGPQPVDLHGSLRELVQTFWAYFRYREEVDQTTGHGGLINDLKAIKALGRFLGIPENVWPKAPTPPEQDVRELPSPEQVHDLLHTQYGPNPRRNPVDATVRYLLMLDFGIGLRFPSEAYQLRLEDVNLEEGTLRVREPKKGDRTRLILVEPEWLFSSGNRMCLENWVTIWRGKTNPTTDRLFPNPIGDGQGQAFPSKAQLGKFLKDRVQPKFPWFTPYLGRHWCATARLIEWDHDYDRVAEWLGHENTHHVRQTYARSARVWEKRYGDNWLSRAFSRRHVEDSSTSDTPETGGHP